jgi:hypothetical protein
VAGKWKSVRYRKILSQLVRTEATITSRAVLEPAELSTAAPFTRPPKAMRPWTPPRSKAPAVRCTAGAELLPHDVTFVAIQRMPTPNIGMNSKPNGVTPSMPKNAAVFPQAWLQRSLRSFVAGEHHPGGTKQNFQVQENRGMLLVILVEAIFLLGGDQLAGANGLL